ncbi:unnamed protein product [Rangifer tarandus platyrhynchus]|uniref:Uncharacterized protein n=1 Tax=Rangifer tarandus platyrhynchus TaxID=3082113 RepID=A0AC59ZV73_RANTA
MLSSCGTSPSRGALHVNQRPLTAAFVGRRQVRAFPQPPSIPGGLPLRQVSPGVTSSQVQSDHCGSWLTYLRRFSGDKVILQPLRAHYHGSADLTSCKATVGCMNPVVPHG